MISLPKFSFDMSPRRALFITEGRARIYHWHKSGLEGVYTFDTSQQGLSLFESYLAGNREEPLYVLTDLPDEEFRLDTIPHVTGRDRRSLLDRKKTKLFRKIKYSYCEIHEREVDGRRDDRVVFSALSEDKALKPWLELLEKCKVPVAGIYSVALISKWLLKACGHESGPALLVSLQRNAGLRQSFFQGTSFKFSRLVRMPRYGTEPYAPVISDEIGKMLRYMRSMRQINNESLVHVHVLGDRKLLDELRQEFKEQAGVSLKLQDIQDLADRTGIKTELVEPFADSLYVQVLLKQKLPNIYATSEETRFFSMRRIRHSLLGSSLLVFLAAFIWSGLAFVDAVTMKQEAHSTANKTEFYSERYRMAQESLPELPVEPENLKLAVDLFKAMQNYRATPLPFMYTVSNGLDGFPDVKIDTVNWSVSMDADTDQTNSTERRGRDPVDRLQNDDRYAFYHIGQISGSLESFDGNYRQALDTINRLAESIRARENVHDVDILRLPLDVSPEARLQGTGESARGESTFALRVVLGVLDED